MRKLLPLLGSALICLSLAAPAGAFKCESGSGTIFSPAECSCTGTNDCKDMRKSKLCKGDLDCKQGACSCTAARLVPADDGGEIKKRITGGVLKNTAPLNAE